MTVRGLVDLFRDEDEGAVPEYANYLERNFKEDLVVFDRDYTGREIIEEMRKGTPFGVLYYHIIGGHWDCCGPGRE